MTLRALAGRIRCQRGKRGLRQSDLANALQVTPQAVSKWERGENAPDLVLLAPLAKLLGVSIDWLLDSNSQDVDVFGATVLASGVQVARHKSAELAPKDFAAWMSPHRFRATEAVVAHGGIPVKYLGPGILCFFSGADHGERALRAAIRAVGTSAEPLKVGVSTGEVYLGSLGHPDYARPDVIGEPVSIALLARDWAADHTASGLAVAHSTLEGMAAQFRASLAVDKESRARLPGIRHTVLLAHVAGLRSRLPVDPSRSGPVPA
jgi:transcriptional regulator with XRE-family HTH domain